MTKTKVFDAINTTKLRRDKKITFKINVIFQAKILPKGQPKNIQANIEFHCLP